MATRTPVEVVPTSYSYVFSPYREPIARVTQGQRVVVHCDDAFESRIRSRDDVPSQALAGAKFLNPQTGPIYVEGAEPGDTLAVEILELRTKDWGWTAIIPGLGLLPDDFASAYLRVFDLTRIHRSGDPRVWFEIFYWLREAGVVVEDCQGSPACSA